MKEAQQFLKAISAEGVDDEWLQPSLLPIHACPRKTVDSHEDVDGNEQPQLRSSCLPCTVHGLAMRVGSGVDGDGLHGVLCQHVLKEVHLRDCMMDWELWAGWQ